MTIAFLNSKLPNLILLSLHFDIEIIKSNNMRDA